MLDVGGALFDDQAGIHECFITLGERGRRYDQVAIVQSAIRTCAFCEREAESKQQMLAFIEELLADLHFRKQRVVIGFKVVGLLVLSRLLKIRAVARTVECDFALFAAALGANASVDRGTKAFFLPEIADCAAHRWIISRHERFNARLHHSWGSVITAFVTGRRINPANGLHKAFLFVRLPTTR
jgi:hypothetical protein